MKKNTFCNTALGLISVCFFVFYLAAGAVGAGAIESFKAEKGILKISGGTAHIPVMKEAAKRIMLYNPNVKISIAGGGSGIGIKQVGEGLVNIGNSGRAPKKEELAKFKLSMFKWALDGVGVVVNPQNPVHSLSTEQIKNIFSGKITNWKDVNGPDKKIHVFTRDEASGTRAVFWKMALQKGTITPKANYVVSNGAMKTAIANDPGAIGYVSVGHIDDSVAGVALDGVVPSQTSVKDGTYKIVRGLYSNTLGEPSGLTKKFIDYLFSEEGQKIVVQNGFISVK